jgi:N-(2-amino-2-carboxyethyl)-L-glutamate synthase
LAAICAARRYSLTCVVDANTNTASVDLMRALGADVVTITERDANGGFLQRVHV